MNTKTSCLGGIVLVSLALLSSCSTNRNSNQADGPANVVLPKKVYTSLQSEYASIHDFSNGHAVVEDAKGRHGLIDNKGNLLIECVYERLWDLVDSYGLCYVRLNGAWGLYDSEYKMIAKCLYDSFRLPSDGLITLSMNRGSVYGALNAKDGSIVIPFDYEFLGNYSEGLFAAEKKIKGKSRYGYINKNNQTVLPFIYADADDFSEGLAAVEKDAKTVSTAYGPFTTSACGFINKLGETVIPFKFPSQWGSVEFHEGLCAIAIGQRKNLFGESEKNAFINQKGETVITGFFDSAEDFENGVALIKKSGKYGYINRSGDIIIPCVYDKAIRRKDELCLEKDDEEYHFTYKGDLIK